MDQINQLAEKSEGVKVAIRKEIPFELKNFIRGKLGRDLLNLQDILQTLFACLNHLNDLEAQVQKGTEQNRQQMIEIEGLKKLRKENEFYELVDKIRATGGQATVSVTLPDRSS
jgi:hypothetical protein